MEWIAPNHSEWMPIDRTFVPALPRRSRLTVHEVTPERFVVTYPIEPGWLFGCLMVPSLGLFGIFSILIMFVLEHRFRVPWWITGPALILGIPWLISKGLCRLLHRPEGGKLQLDRKQFLAESGVFWQWSETHPLNDRSRLNVIDIGSEQTYQALSLQVEQQWKTLAQECDLSVADQKWLCSQMNAWLGHEFPSHCAACGRPLESRDIDWQQRSVCCSECGFLGPAPDPFSLNAAPPCPPHECPCCTGTIWLTDVNRETGGCRCQRCHWASEALPPMRLESFADTKNFLITSMGRAVSVALSASDKFVSNDKLHQEYPSAANARRQLEDDHLIQDNSRDKLSLAFGHWQVSKFNLLVLAIGAILILNIWLLLWVFHGTPPRTWLHWFGRLSSFLMLPVSGGLAAFSVWWGFKRVCLIFTPEALLLQIGQIKRVIRWNTLKEVATHEGVWPPMVYLDYGGSGAVVTPPSHAAARAITRLCQIHCEEQSQHSARTSAIKPMNLDQISPIPADLDSIDSTAPGSDVDDAAEKVQK